MKVIQVMPDFPLAGAEIMCENLIYALKKQGVKVVAVSLFTRKTPITERLESAGIKIVYLDKKPGLDISIIGKLYKLFKEERPTAIHTHRYVMQYAIPAAVLAGIKRRIHTVHSVAQKELRKPARKLAKLFYSCFRVTPVALSQAVKKTIIEEYKLCPDAVPVIHNGIDLSKCIVKKDYSFGDTFTILHIGRFQTEKNHSMLIKAFSKFHTQRADSKLFLIGDGPQKKIIEDLVLELGLGDSVEFLGLQTNVYGYLYNADLFALPSLYEGIPMTLIEAMGTGLPIVASNVGGIPDMVVNGESATLVNVDEDQLAVAFSEMYNDERMRNQYGQRVLALSSKFSSETMAIKYIELYERSLIQ